MSGAGIGGTIAESVGQEQGKALSDLSHLHGVEPEAGKAEPKPPH
jgi:hypothetical protein